MARSKKKARALIPVFIAVLAGSGWFLSSQHTDDHKEASSVSEMASQPDAAVTDSVRSADSVMIYYDVQGEGDHALVFIHCWCCDRTYWDRQVEEFSKDYKVVAIDLGGHGQSGHNRTDWTMAACGADVAAVVNKLGLNNVILVGHSMGGTVMIEAARQLGSRVTALVGVDNLHKLDRQNTENEIREYLASYEADYPGTVYPFVRSLFPPTADSLVADGIAREAAASDKEMGVSLFYNIFSYDYVAALRDVRVPIRCINSDEYPVDIEGNRRVAASFDVTIMPAHGHYIHIVDPEGFNAQLQQTIEEFWPEES